MGVAAKNLLTVPGLPYLGQRDNARRPRGTCNLSCVAMLATDGATADELYAELRSPGGRRELRSLTRLHRNNGMARSAIHMMPPERVHAMLVWLLARHGYPYAKFVESCVRDTIITTLVDDCRPIILFGTFTRPAHRVRSGHMVVAVGANRAGDLMVNDPWGDWTKGYRGDAGHQGGRVVYRAGVVWDALMQREGPGYWAIIPGAAESSESN